MKREHFRQLINQYRADTRKELLDRLKDDWRDEPPENQNKVFNREIRKTANYIDPTNK